MTNRINVNTFSEPLLVATYNHQTDNYYLVRFRPTQAAMAATAIRRWYRKGWITANARKRAVAAVKNKASIV